ncbi:hypothetical protein IFM89_002896 [Coptis chinensis]|uniref:DUF4005 domain-containing protein n=1 Tax=Coptis chinensis TaxID=261450 RepID=A0A835IJ93_9MAGN|nr:hypothetical protein IFM89_002896 [Coptis chinensis]
MVRSSSSCFKMMSCSGGDSIDNNNDDDDIERSEGKGSIDKRGWSFRKKSTRHRVLSNTVTSEIPSSGNKENLESTSNEFHAQTECSVAEKVSVSQWTEEIPPLSTTVNSKFSDLLIAKESVGKTDPLVSTQTAEKTGSLITKENMSEISHNLDESSATVVQAAIRAYLAQRALLKLKNIVKLQAAFRGHLERRQAVGALRCVQAIVKMQVLVRARRARVSLQGSTTEEKIDVALGKEQSGSKANISCSSTEKLLSNGFARQRDGHRHKSPRVAQGFQKEEEKISSPFEAETEVPAEAAFGIVDLKQNVTKAAPSLESEENMISYDDDNFKFQASHQSSSSQIDAMHKPSVGDVDFKKTQNVSPTVDTSRMEMQLEATSQTSPKNSEAGSEQPRRSVKRVATEQPETEGKKFGFGSRKACNPAFAAVQSKFEELSSSATAGRSNNSSQVVGIESKLDSVASTADSGTWKKEISPVENSVSHEPRFHIGGSDCDTELSITSTLDSPDRSEVVGYEPETVVAENIGSEPHKTTDNGAILKSIDVEANNSSLTSESNSSYIMPEQVKREDANSESVEVAVPLISAPLEQKPERSASDMQIQMEIASDQLAYKSSPEGSPRSHITIQDLNGTPSSQVSVRAKRNKVDKSGSSQSRKSLSAGKKSPSNPNHDSGARSSTEQLPRDSKNGKRRNSFGSTKPEHVDQDQRDNSSSSLPSYMQATESAKAKALANSSPRSSPDVQDKDIYIKKRHSLPGANGKQLSPRIQRSMSQAQQGPKGNGTVTQASSHSHHNITWTAVGHHDVITTVNERKTEGVDPLLERFNSLKITTPILTSSPTEGTLTDILIKKPPPPSIPGTLNPKVLLELFSMYQDWQEDKAKKISQRQEEVENKIEVADALAVKLLQRFNYSVSAMRTTAHHLSEVQPLQVEVGELKGRLTEVISNCDALCKRIALEGPESLRSSVKPFSSSIVDTEPEQSLSSLPTVLVTNSISTTISEQ